jgi:hypothetical protein
MNFKELVEHVEAWDAKVQTLMESKLPQSDGKKEPKAGDPDLHTRLLGGFYHVSPRAETIQESPKFNGPLPDGIHAKLLGEGREREGITIPPELYAKALRS